jgi:opacity protein-like surface antigen
MSSRRSLSSSPAFERDESEFHYGLGLNYSLTGNWGLRAEWENTDKLKVQMFSVGVEFKF